MEVFKHDIDSYDTFRRDGYDYKKIERGNGYSIWEIERNGKHMGFEVWKNKIAKNPDGTKVIVRPSNEDFGTYGWYFPTRGPKMDAKINSLLDGRRF